MASHVTKELEVLIGILKKFPRRALIEEIESSSSELRLERRTLQRRLVKLQQEDAIAVSGQGRSTRYQLLDSESKKAPLPLQSDLIPLSKRGKEIQTLVSKPLQQRAPISYNSCFLDSYIPNASFYLSTTEREKLEQMGKTSMPDQPAGTYAKEILSRLLIDLSWNSSRLEGNTYSLLDTQRLISFGEMAGDKSASETQMILNHKDAIEFLVQSVEEVGFNRHTVLNLHALQSNNFLPDPAASGRLRSFGVGIHHSVYEPLAIPQLISERFDLFLAKAEQIQHPFEQAFFVMVHLPYLQPFDDVNKRVCRLAANIPFARHNLAPLSFIDVPHDVYVQGMIGVYELNRIELLKDVFLWAYGRSAARYAALRQSLGEPDPFRFKYRERIRDLIASIVSLAIKPKEAREKIKFAAKELPTQDQEKFFQAVETELLSLHEGNFVRYRIRPSEFKNWKNIWSVREQ